MVLHGQELRHEGHGHHDRRDREAADAGCDAGAEEQHAVSPAKSRGPSARVVADRGGGLQEGQQQQQKQLQRSGAAASAAQAAAQKSVYVVTTNRVPNRCFSVINDSCVEATGDLDAIVGKLKNMYTLRQTVQIVVWRSEPSEKCEPNKYAQKKTGARVRPGRFPHTARDDQPCTKLFEARCCRRGAESCNPYCLFNVGDRSSTSHWSVLR